MKNEAIIFRPRVPEGYEWALPVHSSDYERFRTLYERRPDAPWDPPQMYLLRSDVGKSGPFLRAQMPWMSSSVLILRDEAIEPIASILEPHGEILELRCTEARLAVFSAPLIPDGLDEERSELTRFPDSQRVMSIDKPVFNSAAIQNVHAFKVPQSARAAMYLSIDLVEEIEATGLTAGTLFRPVL